MCRETCPGGAAAVKPVTGWVGGWLAEGFNRRGVLLPATSLLLYLPPPPLPPPPPVTCSVCSESFCFQRSTFFPECVTHRVLFSEIFLFLLLEIFTCPPHLHSSNWPPLQRRGEAAAVEARLPSCTYHFFGKMTFFFFVTLQSKIDVALFGSARRPTVPQVTLLCAQAASHHPPLHSFDKQQAVSDLSHFPRSESEAICRGGELGRGGVLPCRPLSVTTVVLFEHGGKAYF